MNNVLCLVWALTLAAIFATGAEARTIYYGDSPEKVDVRYGKSTVLRFETKVGSVQNAEKFEIGPLNEQSPNYAEMAVKPRSTSAADTVNFLLVDGSVVKLRLVPVSGAAGEATETFHYIKKMQKQVITQDDAEPQTAANGDDTSEQNLELMKALILGSKVRGYKVRSVEKPLATGLTGVEAQLVRVYAGKDLNGYVFRLTNKSSASKYEIDVRRLKIGNPNLALMSQVDRKVIEPEGTKRNVAYLTIVALPSSLSRDVVLPVAWVKKETERK